MRYLPVGKIVMVVTLATALFTLALAQLPPGQAIGQTPAGGLQPETVQRIETILKAEMQRLEIPGLSVAIAVENRLSYANGFGLADLENSVPASAETVYRTASVAKPITAVAVMQLVEKGKLTLDAPIQKYCAAFPPKKWPVTIRQLLAHQGGIRHTRRDEDRTTDHYLSVKDALKVFKDDPLEYEPGTKYRYTTLGYSLLGCAVEGAAGVNFETYLRENTWRPAELERTAVDDWFAVIPQRARGYVKLTKEINDRLHLLEAEKFKSGQIINAWPHDTSMKMPGGGLVSTAVDLARFGIAVQTARLLRADTLKTMWTQQRNQHVRETTQALGWGVAGEGALLIATHSGSQSGVSTDLWLFPSKGIVIALMANLYDAPLGPLRDKVAQALWAQWKQ